MYAHPANMDPNAPNPAAPHADPFHDPHAVEWERTYSMFMHLTLLAVHVFVPVVPALIMWLIKKAESPFVDDHGKEALNFQISMTIYAIAAGITGIGLLLVPVIYVVGIIGMVRAAIAASKGRYHRYPVTIRLVK